MSNTNFEQLSSVLRDILERLIRLEQRLDSMDRAGTKKPVTSESEQAILR